MGLELERVASRLTPHNSHSPARIVFGRVVSSMFLSSCSVVSPHVVSCPNYLISFFVLKVHTHFSLFVMAIVCLETALLSFILSPADGAAKVMEISRMETDSIRMMAGMYNMKLSPVVEDVLPLRARLMDSFRLRVSQISQLSTQALKLLCKMCDLKPPQSVFFAKTTLINYIETHHHEVNTCLWEEYPKFFFSSVSKNDTSYIKNSGGVVEQIAGSVLIVQQTHFTR